MEYTKKKDEKREKVLYSDRIEEEKKAMEKTPRKLRKSIIREKTKGDLQYSKKKYKKH